MDDGNELLLSCLRDDPPDIKIAGLRCFQDYDWDALLHASHRNKTTPILYYTLSPFFSDIRVPAQIQQKLRETYHRAAARNMRVYQQLLKLVRIFNNEGISVILLKGAHLAGLVYGNVALRPMGDLDLLVRNLDLLRVSELLVEHGYSASKEDVGCAQEHLPPFKKDDSLSIEIHFNIVSPPFSQKFDVEELWQRARKESIQGVNVLTLCPEDLFLHLCVHACIHHGFDNGIMPFVDITRTLERCQKEIDWDKVLIRGRQWGVIRCVYVMLALSEKMLGLTVSEHVRMKITPDFSDFDAIASAEELVFGKAAPMASNVARLFGNDSWSDKFKLLIRRAFPPAESMFIRDPRARNPLSLYLMYFYRIRSLLKRYGKGMWLAMLNDKDKSASFGIQNKRNRLKDWFEETQ